MAVRSTHRKEATVSLILLKDDLVLLLKRHSTGWADGYFAPVAGCVDDNESIVDAIIREAHEEANITVRPEWLTFGCVMDAHIIGRGSDCIDFYFIATRWEGEITNNEPHKHKDLGFFPLTNLPEETLPFVKVAIALALQGTRFGEIGWKSPVEIC
jgi:8-oxo-dGTP diphosphatase